jgi:hypothetical protein
MELDLDKIRRERDAKLDPEWIKKYGHASWHAAMAVIGEPPDLKRDAPRNKSAEPRSRTT